MYCSTDGLIGNCSSLSGFITISSKYNSPYSSMLISEPFVIMHISSIFNGHSFAIFVLGSDSFFFAPSHILLYISYTLSWICCSLFQDSWRVGPVWNMFSHIQFLKYFQEFQKDWQRIWMLWCRVGCLRCFQRTVAMQLLIQTGLSLQIRWRQNSPLRYKYPLIPFTYRVCSVRKFSIYTLVFWTDCSLKYPEQRRRQQGWASCSLRSLTTLQRLRSWSAISYKQQIDYLNGT